MTILLVDGDIVAYKAATASETPVHWGDGLWTLHAYEQDVSLRLDTFISTLVDEAPVKDCVIALSDSENYRKEIALTTKQTVLVHESLCYLAGYVSTSRRTTTQLYIGD